MCNVLHVNLPVSALQEFVQLHSAKLETCDASEQKRRRLLSECEAPLSDRNVCSVDDVLQLLQLLYAIANDSSLEANLLGWYSIMNFKVYDSKDKVHVVCPSLK